MDLEDKGSTESGSPGGSSELHSPGVAGGGVVPGIIKKATNISVDKNVGIINSLSVAVGGGGGYISVGSGSGELTMGKKKRGRPRKYDSEGNLRAGSTPGVPAPPGFTLSSPSSDEYSSGPKKGGGKPSVSGNWQALASLGELLTDTAGGEFTPHVVTVYAGEDVAAKILTFAQKDSRGVCVLSANGSVSNVTIRQPGSSGGLLTYEGRFEILTLMGSYMVSDNGGIKSRVGGLSISLASPDGRVIGGGVAGLLMAATPIQIVIGSFVPSGYKIHKKKPYIEPSRISPALPFSSATVTAAVPISQAAPECKTYPMSHFRVQSQGEADNSLSKKEQPNSASTDTTDWNGSAPSSQHRLYPDINLSIPVEEHDAHF